MSTITEPSRPPLAAPPKPLLLLGAGVLAVHLFILQAAPDRPMASTSPPAPPFLTRTVVLAPASAAPAQAVPAPAPRPRKVASPAPPAPTPAPTQASSPLPEPAPQAPTAPSPLADGSPAPAEDPGADTLAESEPDAAPPAAEPAPRATAYAVPGSLKLRYDITGEVRHLSYSARAELLWRHDGDAYQARLEVGAFLLGSRVQASAGRITPEGLAPKRFSDKVRSEVAAHFERDKGKVIFSANAPEVPLQPGAQDHLSIFVQLASLLAGDPERYPAGSAIEMQAVGTREADTWRFTVDGIETLQLPGGTQAALKLTRAPRQTYDLKVELWLAPALGYLPARIRLTQNNGDFIDQQWRASEPP